jgi:integrase
LQKLLKPKHTMRDHYLGNPKTPKSGHTITISPEVPTVLAKHMKDKAPDDFIFTSPTGLPLHNSDFYVRVWQPLIAKLAKVGVASFRFHDLRHTNVAWLIAGAPLAAHPGPAVPRVDHHHHRHLRPPAPGRRRADRQDHRCRLEGKRVRPVMQLVTKTS